jgi:hypothetical protein
MWNFTERMLRFTGRYKINDKNLEFGMDRQENYSNWPYVYRHAFSCINVRC